MGTVVVDIPYEIRIVGVPKRRRTSDMYFVRETVPVEVECRDASEVEATIRNLDLGIHSGAVHPVVDGRILSAVSWIGVRAAADPAAMRGNSNEPLRLDDMETFAAFCRKNDSLRLGRSPFRLHKVEHRGRDVSRYHEKRLADPDGWNSIEESDRDAARADAVERASRIVVVDGVLHSDLHQPVVRSDNGRDWYAGAVDVRRRHSKTASLSATFGYGEPVEKYDRKGSVPRTAVPFGRIACCGLLRDAIELVLPADSPSGAAIGSGTMHVSGVSVGLVDAVFGCRGALRTVDDRSVGDDAVLEAASSALAIFDAALGAESPLKLSTMHGAKVRAFRDALPTSIAKAAELVAADAEPSAVQTPRAA